MVELARSLMRTEGSRPMVHRSAAISSVCFARRLEQFELAGSVDAMEGEHVLGEVNA